MKAFGTAASLAESTHSKCLKMTELEICVHLVDLVLP